MELKKITVITVCYNAVHLIEDTIKSVLSQDYQNVEYIVIDGGSTDGTIDIIKKYSDKLDKWISEPDKGVYDAMNKGIDLASGDWINFMNSGDQFANKNVISNFFKQANSIVHDGLLYGDVILKYPIGMYYKDCHNSSWCHQSVFASSKLLQDLHFDLSYKIFADEDFIERAKRNGHKLVYVPQVVAIYECYDGLSSTSGLLVYKEKQRIHNLPKSLQWYWGLLIVSIKTYIKKKFKISNNDKRHYRKLKEFLDNSVELKRIDK